MPDDLLMTRGAAGADIAALKARLATELGDDARIFPGLAQSDVFDEEAEAALRRWQAGTGITADGVAGPHCMKLLGLREWPQLEWKPDLPAMRALFPQTKPSNIVRYLPYVTDAMAAAGLSDRTMLLAALGTIRAETAGFIPISEYPSRFNTLPGQAAFSAYEPGTSIGEALGNTQPGDGARYRGRGFVQLTGSENYYLYTLATGVDLAGQPDLANSPEVAAVLLALFLANRAGEMRAAIEAGRFAAARKLVNGGTHGLDDFRGVLLAAKKMEVAAAVAGRGSKASAAGPAPVLARKRDTKKDPPDLRDRLYLPPPLSLPDVYPPQRDVKAKLADYRKLVLDQGADGSCTGYGLACVINFARWAKADYAGHLQPVSARMLYNFARRYDEYAGQDYEGSSCRGALKGWFHHGVCSEADWPDHQRPRYGYAQRATQVTLGVYYRIDIKAITDMQAAIQQAHSIYVSAYTHDGWTALLRDPPSREVPTHESLPAIAFDGRPSKSGGHAFALVGFNTRGFIVQNSWGPAFGTGGFAVLTYADWLANGMDAWVASLGVPGVVSGRLAAGSAGGATARAGGGAWEANWWDERTAYEHSIVMGNDGRVTRYLTQDEMTRSLLYQACALPDQWFRTDPAASKSDTKRIVIYAHGGLNSEKDAISRARAMGRFFTGNGCYPIFLVWKTGLLESLQDIVEGADLGTQRVGGVFDKLFDATDLVIEKTIGRGPARRVWSEMKENAEFSCTASRGCDHLANALQNLAATWGGKLEIHLVGHSAGSILLGYLLEVLTVRALNAHIATTHLFAPACTVQFANRHYATQERVMRNLWLHILADEQERSDNVAAIYRKSLLYLISGALEPDERTPILGLERVRDPKYTGWDGSSTTAQALGSWRDAVRAAQLDQRTQVVGVPKVIEWKPKSGAAATVRASHGSFDNNIEVINTTLQRIVGSGTLKMPVDDLRGF